MSGKLKVPAKRAANPSAGREFPEGLYLMTIEEARNRTQDPQANPKLAWAFQSKGENKKGEPKRPRFGGPTADVLGLQLGQGQSLEEGQDDPGKQKMFCDLTVRDGDTFIDEVGEDADGLGYQILIDGALFTNLALALGQAYEEDGYVYPSDDFRESLIAGKYNGFKVIVKVKHREWTSAAGKKGVSVEVEYFQPAA
jgi:hypothetical protein